MLQLEILKVKNNFLLFIHYDSFFHFFFFVFRSLYKNFSFSYVRNKVSIFYTSNNVTGGSVRRREFNLIQIGIILCIFDLSSGVFRILSFSFKDFLES